MTDARQKIQTDKGRIFEWNTYFEVKICADNVFSGANSTEEDAPYADLV